MSISSIRIEQHAIVNPPVPNGAIRLYEGGNFGSSSYDFTYVGNDYCTNLSPYGWDNRARSLQFRDGYVGGFDVILYDDNGCGVYNARYGSDASDLGAFNAKISSIRIERHAPPRPDLIPTPRSGRSAPVVISPVSNTLTNGTLYAGEPIFIDWGYKNQGPVNALAHNLKLTINGQTVVDYPFSSLSASSNAGFDDWVTTWDTPGTFTVTLTVDSNSAVNKSDEGNNVWTGQFTWSLRPPNQFVKISPVNAASNLSFTVNLAWNPSSGVTSYEVCFNLNDNNACDTNWINVGTATMVQLTGLSSNQKLFWQVRAVTAPGAPTRMAIRGGAL